MQQAEGEHRLPIAVGKREVADIELECEGIEADLTQRELPLVVRADEIVETGAQEMGDAPEARHGVQDNEQDQDGECNDVSSDGTREHWPPPSRNRRLWA